MKSEDKGFVLKDNEKKAEARSEFPEINFSTFILSLNASALASLGLIEDPVARKKNKNLEMGNQTINILSMLHEKTKGNLNREEDKMLEDILYNLRLAYVKQAG